MFLFLGGKDMKLSASFLQLMKNKYFIELYVFIIAIITVLGWMFSSEIGMIVLIIIASAVLLLTNDLMTIIPILVFFLFGFNEGFSNKEFPIMLIGLASVFALLLIVHLFRNGLNIHKMKSVYGLLLLAILNLIPIFWNDTITSSYTIFFGFYFANLGYLLVYLLVVNGIKKANFHLLATTFSFLGILLALECTIKALEVLPTTDSIFNVYYHLGWGLCNEAGIMISFSIPFIFYLIGKTEDFQTIIWHLLKLLVALIGLILTTSRGAYLCGFAEVGILSLILLFKAKAKKNYRIIFSCLLSASIVLFFVGYQYTFPLVEKLVQTVFNSGLDDNGRVEIWQQGFAAWQKNPLTIIFGPGICAVVEMRESGVDGTLVDQLAPLVFHSTFVETLAVGGILALIALGIHLFEKYRSIILADKLAFYTIGLGMLLLDLYGLIDNTYHMYYYMIPLVLMLAVFDNFRVGGDVDEKILPETNQSK